MENRSVDISQLRSRVENLARDLHKERARRDEKAYDPNTKRSEFHEDYAIAPFGGDMDPSLLEIPKKLQTAAQQAKASTLFATKDLIRFRELQKNTPLYAYLEGPIEEMIDQLRDLYEIADNNLDTSALSRLNQAKVSEFVRKRDAFLKTFQNLGK